MRSLEYCGYPSYRGGAGLWGGGAYPSMMLTGYGGSQNEDRAQPSHHGRWQLDVRHALH